MSSLLFAFASRSSIPLIRTSGAIASILLCINSFGFLFFPSNNSMFQFFHNFADLILYLFFGFAGLVAEIFPRDSLFSKILKSNFPLINTLLGRGIVYVLFGMIVMGMAGNDQNAITSGLYAYFCIFSGLYMSIVGIVLLINSPGTFANRSLIPETMAQPIFVPNVVSHETLTRAPQEERTISPFPTTV